MKAKQTILFLYTELAAYTIACLQKLSEQGVEVHLVRYPVNQEAPFAFENSNAIHFYERKEFTKKGLEELVEKLQPKLICCSGWIDKDYVSVCKKYSKKLTTVLAFDNRWRGTLKQFIASIAGKLTISKYFKYAWVPGEQQVAYAIKLGFNRDRIITGFYSCDQKYFNSIFERNKKVKEDQFPHKFIFVGRYYDFKGISELWEAFVELKAETKTDWELWCLGKGDIKPVEHPAIKHFGFVQPGDMEKFMRETGVFILPSRFEPWGVALHEFAAAGFPLLCSDEVGAGGVFLKENENGFSFHANDKNDIKSKLKQIISLSDHELNKMGEKSNEYSKRITTETWANSILNILNK